MSALRGWERPHFHHQTVRPHPYRPSGHGAAAVRARRCRPGGLPGPRSPGIRETSGSREPGRRRSRRRLLRRPRPQPPPDEARRRVAGAEDRRPHGHRPGEVLGRGRGPLRGRRDRHRRPHRGPLREQPAVGRLADHRIDRTCPRGLLRRERSARDFAGAAGADGGRSRLAARDDPEPAICACCSTASSLPAASSGSASATRPPPSTTTRPTATGCSSTRSRSRRASAPRPPSSRASTATSRSPERCSTTSASSRPTTTTRSPSTSPTSAG